MPEPGSELPELALAGSLLEHADAACGLLACCGHWVMDTLWRLGRLSFPVFGSNLPLGQRIVGQ